jgi:hypothetical protein
MVRRARVLSRTHAPLSGRREDQLLPHLPPVPRRAAAEPGGCASCYARQRHGELGNRGPRLDRAERLAAISGLIHRTSCGEYRSGRWTRHQLSAPPELTLAKAGSAEDPATVKFRPECRAISPSSASWPSNGLSVSPALPGGARADSIKTWRSKEKQAHLGNS